MKNPEYQEGPDARKTFDDGMTKLFRAPKIPIKEPKPKPDAKPVDNSKD